MVVVAMPLFLNLLLDQAVDETLRKIRMLSSTLMKMLSTSFPWKASKALQDSIVGDTLFQPQGKRFDTQ
jgi:hypothetical protein